MKKTLLFLVFFLVVAGRMLKGQVTVAPTDNLQSLVNANPAGTTFILQPGVHHDSVTSLKNGDTFTGLKGAIENGATTLTGWTQVTINSFTYWTTAGGTPVSTTYTNVWCAPGFPGCYLPQDLYLDSVTYTHVLSLSGVAAGKWYYEYQGLTAASVAGGGSGYAVGDILTVSGGTGGKVKVTSVSSGAVGGVSIIAVGSGYPTSSATKSTTGGTGSGCTLTVQGGSGGVTNNVYLANSENPNSHTVELGRIKTLLQSSSATGITVQGLTWEKYAGDIDHGPVSVCSAGDPSCFASGWTIQNNEARLNRMDGIHSGGQNHPGITVRNNVVHHNGQYGVAFGADNSLMTGNTIYANNADRVSCGYGAGGVKAVGLNDIFSYNASYANYCNGLWTDQNSSHHTYDHNLVYFNVGEGIRYEISDYGIITNNTLYGNGPGSDGTAQYQIDYSSSAHGTIQNNILTLALNQIGIKVEYVASRAGPPLLPVGMNVSNNTVITPSNLLMAAAIDYSIPTTFSSWGTPGMFDSNCYQVPSLPWTNTNWKFGPTAGPSATFGAWQGSPNLNDAHGTLLLTGCLRQGTTLSGGTRLTGQVLLK